MQTFFAMITLLEGQSPGAPTHPIAPGGQPPGIWPDPGHPSHPIAPGGRPPGIWGGAPPYPDQGLPGPQPHPEHPIVIPPGSMAPGVPTHPIIIPPEQPATPTHPIVIPPDTAGPGVPSHPIVIPPAQPPRPDQGLPGSQPHPDQGLPGSQPGPSHPIVLPPVPPVPPDGKALVFVKTAGQDGVWFVLDKNDALKPTHPQPKAPAPKT